MTIYHEDQERRAAEVWGLRLSRGRICPRVVAGKRCIAYNDNHRLCICQTFHHLLDHGRMWLDEAGQHVLTGEPYEVDTTELLDLIAAVAELGLSVDISARSMWNPGYCVLIRVTRKHGNGETDA